MDSKTSFSNSIYLEQETREDVELAGFTQAVADEFGSEQAMLSERDWLSKLAQWILRLYQWFEIGGRSRLRLHLDFRVVNPPQVFSGSRSEYTAPFGR